MMIFSESSTNEQKMHPIRHIFYFLTGAKQTELLGVLFLCVFRCAHIFVWFEIVLRYVRFDSHLDRLQRTEKNKG